MRGIHLLLIVLVVTMGCKKPEPAYVEEDESMTAEERRQELERFILSKESGITGVSSESLYERRLAGLSKESDVSTRREVARNPLTPSSVLIELSKDTDSKVREFAEEQLNIREMDSKRELTGWKTRPGACKETGSLGLSTDEVEFFSGYLEEIVLPQSGTNLSEVNSVYGLPERSAKAKPGFKMRKPVPACNTYKLIGYPSLMHVQHDQGIVKESWLVYRCRPSGFAMHRRRKGGMRLTSEAAVAYRRKDLLEIVEVFENYSLSLERAPWNKFWANDEKQKADLRMFIAKVINAKKDSLKRIVEEADVAYKNKEYDKALRLYLSIYLDHEGGVKSCARAGDCLKHLKLYEETARVYEICLKNFPKGSGRHNISEKLGDVYVLMGKLKKAIQVYEDGSEKYGCCKFDFEKRVTILREKAGGTSGLEP